MKLESRTSGALTHSAKKSVSYIFVEILAETITPSSEDGVSDCSYAYLDYRKVRGGKLGHNRPYFNRCIYWLLDYVPAVILLHPGTKSYNFITTYSQLPFPRVYVSDSSWLQRHTDVFRFITRGSEAAFRGYRLVVPLSLRINSCLVSKELFQSQDASFRR